MGSAPSGAIYRLRDATVTVRGPATMEFNSETDPDRTSSAQATAPAPPSLGR